MGRIQPLRTPTTHAATTHQDEPDGFFGLDFFVGPDLPAGLYSDRLRPTSPLSARVQSPSEQSRRRPGQGPSTPGHPEGRANRQTPILAYRVLLSHGSNLDVGLSRSVVDFYCPRCPTGVREVSGLRSDGSADRLHEIVTTRVTTVLETPGTRRTHSLLAVGPSSGRDLCGFREPRRGRGWCSLGRGLRYSNYDPTGTSFRRPLRHGRLIPFSPARS